MLKKAVQQGRRERLTMILPSLLVYVARMARMSPPHCARPTRAFLGRALREHKGAHRVIPPLLADFFSILLRFRLDTFNIESDLHLVTDDEPAAIQGLVPDHTEIFTVEFPFSAETGSGIAPGILCRPVITAD